MITVPNHRHRKLLLLRVAPAKQGHGHLERGALSVGAVAALAAIWLAIGFPGLPGVLQAFGGRQNETPLVASAADDAQPRPHAIHAIAERATTTPRRSRRKAAPRTLQLTSAVGRLASPNIPLHISTPPIPAQAPVRDTPPDPGTASQATGTPPTTPAQETPTAPASTTRGTQAPVSPTATTPLPPETSGGGLPDLPSVPTVPTPPDLPPLPALPSVPPPPPTVTLPQLPPLPPLPSVVDPTQQLPQVQAPTQTLLTTP